MRKRLLLGASILASVAMLCGFDSAETADSVLQKMQEAEQNVNSVAMNMNMNLDAAIELSDSKTTSSLAATMSGDFDIAASLDPLAMSMKGSMSVSALTYGDDITMEMYGITGDDGEFKTYTYTKDSASGEEGSWSYSASPLEGIDMDQLKNTTISASEFAEWGVTFALASEPADVDGTECYVLSTSITSDTLNTIIQKVSNEYGVDLSSEQDVSSALAMLTGLKLNLAYYIDPATYLPVKMVIDMNDSDLAFLNEVLAAYMGSSGTTVNIKLNDLSITCMTDYNAPVEITVPQEALDAVASGAATDLAGALSQAG